MDSIPKNIIDVFIKMLSVLECPICFEYVMPPVRQCTEGHILCGSCKSKLEDCPVCHQEFCDIRIRSLDAIAEMMLYPCNNDGCEVLMNLGERAKHENECSFPKSDDDSKKSILQNNILKNISEAYAEYFSNNKGLGMQENTHRGKPATAPNTGLNFWLPKLNDIDVSSCCSERSAESETCESSDGSEVTQQFDDNRSECGCSSVGRREDEQDDDISDGSEVNGSWSEGDGNTDGSIEELVNYNTSVSINHSYESENENFDVSEDIASNYEEENFENPDILLDEEVYDDICDIIQDEDVDDEYDLFNPDEDNYDDYDEYIDNYNNEYYDSSSD